MTPFDEISDLHICGSDLDASIAFPGPRKLDEPTMECAKELLKRCRAYEKSDFMVSLNGMFFRGRKEERAVDGVWYRLRKMPGDSPALNRLPSKIPAALQNLLMSERLRSGGLIYIVGAPGQGKTTTASATLVSRLEQFGGFAYTVEDPPEMPLNGWHNNGYCCQSWVAGDSSADWAESFRGVLRSQPSGTPTILYVGEVRDSESAQAMLRAASNGFLVIATGFGTDVVSGLEALVSLSNGGEAIRTSLSGLLRIVVHQRIVRDQLVISSLASVDGKTSVAAKIRQGNMNMLQSDIQFQANQSLLGVDAFASQAST